MGRRDRGQDQVDVQRHADKKRRLAFKNKQKELSKQLRTKIDDDNATSASIAAELEKLDGFKHLSVEQRQLKESLSEKLLSLQELERMKAEFDRERAARRAKGERTSDDDDDNENDQNVDDDDDDDFGNDNDDDQHRVETGHKKPEQPSCTVTLDDDDPWAALLKAEEAEAKKQQSQPQKSNTASLSAAAAATTTTRNTFDDYRPDLALKHKQQKQEQQKQVEAKQHAIAVAAFVPIARIVGPAAGAAKKKGEEEEVDDPELAAFLQGLVDTD